MAGKQTESKSNSTNDREIVIDHMQLTHEKIMQQPHVANNEQVQAAVEAGFLLCSHHGPWVRLSQISKKGIETCRVVNVGRPEQTAPEESAGQEQSPDEEEPPINASERLTEG